VVATLPLDTEVIPVERRDGWVLVRIGGAGGTPEQEGWVNELFLKETARP
jgi:hypothetical protein